jgi:hypothetical protein
MAKHGLIQTCKLIKTLNITIIWNKVLIPLKSNIKRRRTITCSELMEVMMKIN